MQKDLKKSGGTDYFEVLNKPLLPTAYLAPIGYYAFLLQQPNCIIEYYEHFIKQSIRNRCEIYTANGKLQLTIPKKRQGSSKTKISKIKISYKEAWQKNHWNSIISAYNSSPFFEHYKDKIEPLFKQQETYLIDFNNKLQKIILNFLDIDFEYKNTIKYDHMGNFTDLREYEFKIKNMKIYNQVFMEKNGFISNLSILDLLFNLGPESREYLDKLDINI